MYTCHGKSSLTYEYNKHSETSGSLKVNVSLVCLHCIPIPFTPFVFSLRVSRRHHCHQDGTKHVTIPLGLSLATPDTGMTNMLPWQHLRSPMPKLNNLLLYGIVVEISDRLMYIIRKCILMYG